MLWNFTSVIHGLDKSLVAKVMFPTNLDANEEFVQTAFVALLNTHLA